MISYQYKHYGSATAYCLVILFAALLTVSLTGCPEEDDWDEGGGRGIEPITSGSAGQFVVRQLADGAIEKNINAALANGTYDGTVVNGMSGTATVDGHYHYDRGMSCGTDCVRSVHDASMTIVFDRFRVTTSDNSEITVSGTVAYTNTTWSRQSGLSYSSGGKVRVSGSNVDCTWIVDSDGDRWGYSDTISFDASGDSAAYVNGSISASNGSTYTF